MNIGYVIAAAVALMVTLNRGLFSLEEYKRFSAERATDMYMKNVCDQIDYRLIGRHAAICSEIDHRLSMHIVFHVCKSVVNDTIYREITPFTIFKSFVVLSFFKLFGTLQRRYSGAQNLPLFQRVCKLE